MRPLPLQRAVALGLDDEAIERGLRTYPGLPHRMERVAEKDGVLFVNDSKATNPTATAPALAAFPKIRWILGGQAKTDNLDECAPHFGHVRKAYTIGEAGEMFASLLSPHMAVAECVTLDEAVKAAAAEAEAGGHGAAVAGLRFLRPVSGFRGAGRCVPRRGGGIMNQTITGRIKASTAWADPNRYGRSDRSTAGRWFWEIDRVLLFMLALLIGFGLIAVAAASPGGGAALFGRIGADRRALLFLPPDRLDRAVDAGDDRHLDAAARPAASGCRWSARCSASSRWRWCRGSAPR